MTTSNKFTMPSAPAFTNAELEAARAELQRDDPNGINELVTEICTLGVAPDVLSKLIRVCGEIVFACVLERAARIRERLSLVLSVDTAEALRREDYVLAHASRVMSKDTLRQMQNAERRVLAAESLVKTRDAEHVAATQALKACGIITDNVAAGIVLLVGRGSDAKPR